MERQPNHVESVILFVIVVELRHQDVTPHFW